MIAVRHTDVWRRWFSEVSRSGATDMSAGSPAAYGVIVLLMLPWTAFLVYAAVMGWKERRIRTASAAALAWVWLIVPIVIMSFFRDRKERYLLPMVGPAAVLAAIGLRLCLPHNADRENRANRDCCANRAGRWLIFGHWILMSLLCVGFPIAAGFFFPWFHRPAWYAPGVAIAMAIASGALLLATLIGRRLWKNALIIGSAASLLQLQAFFMVGYSRSDEGLSGMRPLAEAIRQRHGDAPVWYYRPDGKRKLAPNDLSIYLNRAVPLVFIAPPREGDPVLVMIDRANHEPPTPPPGFIPFATVERDGDKLTAYELPNLR